MAASSLLALIDDIASLLDDVAVLSKVAVKKTAGVLGDDLALNAQQVTGISPNRELPVVWAVAKGSFVNKAILVPAALVVSLVIPWAITPLLMIGGLYLCYEGCEKIAHKIFADKGKTEGQHHELVRAVANPAVDLVEHEKTKIKGAIRTDFILSAEIIVITLGSVAGYPLSSRVLTLVVIAVAMTIGVYGLVAGIVKLDDLGLHLIGTSSKAKRGIGAAILWAAPWLMKTLSVVGTAAMFLVGGGILVHGIPSLHHFLEPLGFFSHFADLAIGFLLGTLILAVITMGKKAVKSGYP